jgi:hypothetical protein
MNLAAVGFFLTGIERSTRPARAWHHHIVRNAFENSIDLDFSLMLSEVSSRFDI